MHYGRTCFLHDKSCRRTCLVGSHILWGDMSYERSFCQEDMSYSETS